jgi:hypothetical protein
MVEDSRLEQFRILWTTYLADYVLIEYAHQSVVCNRETQMPLMIEDEEIRNAVIQKFIEAGVEKIIGDDGET